MTTTTPHEGLRVTRVKVRLWDRGMFLIGLLAAFLVLTFTTMADFEGIISFGEAAQHTGRAHPWIFWLLAAETVRQAHFLAAERSSGYHRFWSRKVFGGWERWSHRRFGDWTRFRVARAVKIAFWMSLVALVLGAVLDVSPFIAPFRAPALVVQALPFVLQVVFLVSVIVIQVAGLLWFLARGGVETYPPDDIQTRFADVWGQDHVLERVKENIVLLDRPGAIEERGGYVPGGLLLWGPPGTGKRLMAEAVAGETGKPYVSVDPGAFTGMLMGGLKVKALFRKLRKLALRHGGVIVFFDEADALGRRERPARQGVSACHGLDYLSQETRSVLAFTARRPEGGGMNDSGALRALLTELSGLKKPRGLFNRQVRRVLGMRPKPPPKYRILVMMATSRPGALDEALLRPGRIDRVHKVGYPSKAGRVRTYQGYFDRVRHELTPGQIGKLAAITPYATGATIKDLVNESLITAIRDGREVITWADVLRAQRFRRLGPPEDTEDVERERHAAAVHEACHAVVAYHTRSHLEIDVATIEKGADHLGMAASIGPEDRVTRWKSEYEADIMVSLASLAGERMFFAGDNSSGVSGDLHAATLLTALMESCWGMGSGVASLPALRELEIMGGRTGQSGLAPDMLGERIEVTLARLLEKAERLLREHRREVLGVAHALETHRTLDGDDVVAIIERRAGPLVDGSVYVSDELHAELEDYHREAARAHHEHGRIERELPGVAADEVVQPAAVPLRNPPMPAPPVPSPAGPGRPGAVPSWGGSGSGGPAVPAAGGTARPEFVAWAPPQQARPQQVQPQPARPQQRRPQQVQPQQLQPQQVPPRHVHPHQARPQPVHPHQVRPPRAHPQRPVDERARPGLGRAVLIAAGSLAGLVVVAVLGALAVTRSGPTVEPASPGLLVILFVVVVALIVGACLAVVAVRGLRAARARAEGERDRAHARAQLLAAAMDPDTAMRLLGYDGGRAAGEG
ncbi:AAA family ATPase [Nonomuraea sp. NPDC050547]|uniref:AAA family ATPase n=1 Tax=Nonomuraea sp. NPDC050547 TaxID=3364368 RepID=UPI00379D3DC9